MKLLHGWKVESFLISKTDMLCQEPHTVPTIKDNLETLEEFFRQNSHPSSLEQAQLAKNLGLETYQVKRWFFTRRCWVCNKLKDPSYLEKMSVSVKQAIEFSKEFKETRQRLGYSIRDIGVQSQGIEKQNWHTRICQFENLQVSEEVLLKYHILLADWMANLPGPKKKSRNRKLLAKHREYLQHVFNVEGEYPTSARLREIADLTGISVKSLQNWFGHERLEKDKILKS